MHEDLDDEIDFYRRKAKVDAFEKELKEVFDKHKVVLKEYTELWHGGSEDIIQLHVDGEHWISHNFGETLTRMELIKT